jgi:PPP family 3-phenylpropionic acid transporter
VAEVVLFALMPRLLEHFSLRGILLVSLALCVLRWSLTAWFSEQLMVMLFAQLLHAATFGSVHAVGIALVQHYFSPSTQGRGQALFSSLGFGAGGALGAVLAGQLWNDWGAQTFVLAVGVSVLAIVLASIWIYPEKAQQNS